MIENIFKKSDGLLHYFEKIEKCKESLKVKTKFLFYLTFGMIGVFSLIIIGLSFYSSIFHFSFPLIPLAFIIFMFSHANLERTGKRRIKKIKHDFYINLVENNHLLDDIFKLCIDEYSKEKFLSLVDCIIKKVDNDAFGLFSMIVENYKLNNNGNKEYVAQRQEFLKNLSIDIASHEIKDNDLYEKTPKQKLLEML